MKISHFICISLIMIGPLLSGANSRMLGQTLQPTDSIDSQIAALREVVNKNDYQMPAPAGWHWVTLAQDHGRAIVPDGQDVGVFVQVTSTYEQKDPVWQLQGIGAAAERYAGGIGSLFAVLGSKYQNKQYSPSLRNKGLNGYIFAYCSARDVTNDNVNRVWFFVNGYSIERIWFVAPTQRLATQYEPMLENWIYAWIQRRALTVKQQIELTLLLQQTGRCKYTECQ